MLHVHFPPASSGISERKTRLSFLVSAGQSTEPAADWLSPTNRVTPLAAESCSIVLGEQACGDQSEVEAADWLLAAISKVLCIKWATVRSIQSAAAPRRPYTAYRQACKRMGRKYTQTRKKKQSLTSLHVTDTQRDSTGKMHGHPSDLASCSRKDADCTALYMKNL